MVKFNEMTNRIKNASATTNLEPVVCEKYMARVLRQNLKDAVKSNTATQNHKLRDKPSKHFPSVNNYTSKVQENLPQKHRKSCGNLIEHLEDAVSLQPSVSTVSRHRSKSAADNEPWGQVLKSEKSMDRSSIFGSFDPLRTLHFLVKELQFQLKAILPNDNTVLQIVLDMHQALKRVPPEVASTIHIQQALDLLPVKNSTKTMIDIPEKLKSTAEKTTQFSSQVQENEKLQKIMVENSLKLEASCKEMETICMNLKTEKEDMEKHLQMEKENVILKNKYIEDLEKTNNLYTSKMRKLEKENEEMRLQIERLKITYEKQQLSSINNLKSQISDLNNFKIQTEQECTKLKHQLKLSNLEKEKCSAIISVRNQQIDMMKNELIQLHEVVSDKFLGLQKFAEKSLPTIDFLLEETSNERENNKENVEECTISTIHSNQFETPFTPKENKLYKELPSGDIDITDFYINMAAKPHQRIQNDVRSGLLKK